MEKLAFQYHYVTKLYQKPKFFLFLFISFCSSPNDESTTSFLLFLKENVFKGNICVIYDTYTRITLHIFTLFSQADVNVLQNIVAQTCIMKKNLYMMVDLCWLKFFTRVQTNRTKTMDSSNSTCFHSINDLHNQKHDARNENNSGS